MDNNPIPADPRFANLKANEVGPLIKMARLYGLQLDPEDFYQNKNISTALVIFHQPMTAEDRADVLGNIGLADKFSPNEQQN